MPAVSSMRTNRQKRLPDKSASLNEFRPCQQSGRAFLFFFYLEEEGWSGGEVLHFGGPPPMRERPCPPEEGVLCTPSHPTGNSLPVSDACLSVSMKRCRSTATSKFGARFCPVRIASAKSAYICPMLKGSP